MSFDDLTWEDLKEWAGSRVVTRGKSYRRAVEDLRKTPDGRLLAWVQGGDRYATSVGLSRGGKLSSTCTCPYAVSCKHAVAIVLAYLEAVGAGTPVPSATSDDERLGLIAEAQDVDEPDEDDWGEDEADEPGSIGDAPSGAAPAKNRAAKRRRSEDPDAAVRCYLEALSHEALLDFVRGLANDLPDVRQRIVDRAELQSGDVKRLLANTRREIANVSAEPGWSRHWSDERHIPDYSRVKGRLESLLASGHADEVVALGEDLLRRGIRQVEMSHDEGETGREIAACMAIVFRALKASSMTAPERLLWEIDARMRDDYAILDGIEGPVASGHRIARAAWSAVADDLARRLDAMPVDAKGDTGGGDNPSRRRTLMRWLLDALSKAGREPEITAILTREAGITHCYVELVDHLLAVGLEATAAEWARKGFKETIDEWPGIAWSLEERLRDLAARRKDEPLVAAYRAMEFFDRPDADRFAKIQEATTKLGLWETIRPMLLRWLETGVRPDESPLPATQRRGRTKGAAPQMEGSRSSWPLPPTGLSLPRERHRHRTFPDTATLIAIAIQEKRNEDVLRWHERAIRRGGYWHEHQDEAVADAVQETHPDAALAIWLRTVKTQIALTNPAAYQIAGAHLAKMKAVYQRTGRPAEWERLLAALRAEHARKRRMLEVLDGLEGKRTRIIPQTEAGI